MSNVHPEVDLSPLRFLFALKLFDIKTDNSKKKNINFFITLINYNVYFFYKFIIF